jgi:hypothetical protein
MDMRLTNELIVAGLLVVGCAQAAAQDLLPVEHGTYVREGFSAEDPPFAAIIEYDGTTLSGPHSNACRSTVLSHHGKDYLLSTTCAALGDGTPAAPYGEEERVVVQSSTKIRLAHGNDAASYRLVPTL